MGRELTRTEKAAIRRLVSKWCANYDRDCGCLPLDCECYMFGKCWTGAYCRYFREAVLPLDPQPRFFRIYSRCCLRCAAFAQAAEQ